MLLLKAATDDDEEGGEKEGGREGSESWVPTAKSVGCGRSEAKGLPPFISFNQTMTLWGRNYHHPHFTDGETMFGEVK